MPFPLLTADTQIWFNPEPSRSTLLRCFGLAFYSVDHTEVLRRSGGEIRPQLYYFKRRNLCKAVVLR